MVNREKRSLRLLGFSNQKAESIKLVKGTVKRNPHVRVLCPTLSQGRNCSKGANSLRFRKPYRPELLVKNHKDPNLQLWSCEGCPQFLLRVTV